MSTNDFIARYPALPSEQQIHLLVQLAAEVTVWARRTYEVGTENVADPRTLRTFNEFEHRVVGQLAHLLDGSANRYPDDVFAEMLVAYARELQCEQELLRTWQRTLNAAAQPGPR